MRGVPPLLEPHDLGDVFPVGIMSAEELRASLDEAMWGAQSPDPRDRGEFDLIVVPEPGVSVITVVLAGVRLLSNRRRQVADRVPRI